MVADVGASGKGPKTFKWLTRPRNSLVRNLLIAFKADILGSRGHVCELPTGRRINPNLGLRNTRIRLFDPWQACFLPSGLSGTLRRLYIPCSD